jgi:dihydroneopterin aldolase/2-amino-4-hydroxy-6-hydroxymethyldihydropteridine diphosphokinase
MDSIFIKNLEVYAYHGCCDTEKLQGQKFYVCCEYFFNTNKISELDDLERSVNYDTVCDDIIYVMTKDKFNLIETCAEKLARFLLNKYVLIKKINIEIKKPQSPIKKSFKYISARASREWHEIYLGLGSNLGDKENNLNQALKLLEENNNHTRVLKVSKYYQTKPWGYLEQDDFLNAAAEIKSLLSPNELIEFLLDIEKKLKRVRKFKNGPRTIDLDILFYDKLILDSDEKILIPHPDLHNRSTVLDPMCDINKYFIHPILKKSILDLKKDLEAKK